MLPLSLLHLLLRVLHPSDPYLSARLTFLLCRISVFCFLLSATSLPLRAKNWKVQERVKERTMAVMGIVDADADWDTACSLYSQLRGSDWLDRWMPAFANSKANEPDPSGFAKACGLARGSLVAVADPSAEICSDNEAGIIKLEDSSLEARGIVMDCREFYKYGTVLTGKQVSLLHLDPPYGLTQEAWDANGWEREGVSPFLCALLALHCALVFLAVLVHSMRESFLTGIFVVVRWWVRAMSNTPWLGLPVVF